MDYFKFGLYFLAFMLVESAVNDKAAVCFGVENVNYIYALGLCCTAFGYFLYMLICKKKNKKRELAVISLISVVASICMYTAVNKWIALFMMISSLLSLGYIGGYVHALLAEVFETEFSFGKKLGIATAAAIVIQFIVQNLSGMGGSFIICILICGIVINIPWDNEAVEKTVVLDNTNANTMGKDFWVLVIITAIMSVALTTQDVGVVLLNAKGDIHLFSAVRLFYALGLCAAGIVYDYKREFSLSLTSAVALLLSVVAITLMDVNTYNLGMSVMYFYCGFYVVFFTIMFISYSVSNGIGREYAGVGRIVRCLSTAVATVALSVGNSYIDKKLLIIINTTLLVGMFLIMGVFGLLTHPIEPVKVASTGGNSLQEYVQQFNLTPRENEVFIALATSEMGVQEIADEMGISRRMLQKHIASVYDKLGVKTRIGILISYEKYIREGAANPVNTQGSQM